MSSHSSKERHEHSSQAPSCSYIHNQLSGMLSFGLPKRYMRLVFAVIFSIAIWCSAQKYIGAQSATGATSVAINVPFPQVQEVADSELPPLFESYRQYEDDVSEQNIDIQNNTQRYIFFANQAHGCGWGNVLQEIVFNALLASEANLGYVWDDYTWSREGEYAVFNGRKIPSRIPISTMLAGHMLGLGPHRSLPPSISSRTFNKICSLPDRATINRDMVQAYLTETGSPTVLGYAHGDEVLKAWVSYLRRPDLRNSRCIQVQRDTLAAFDIWLLGSTRIHSLWKKLSQSPVLSGWNFSPLIYGVFERNIHLFSSGINGGLFSTLWSFFGSDREHPHVICPAETCIPSPLLPDESTSLPLLVLHLRRGDFQEHCSNLAEWNSTFTGFNSFPEFQVRDRFILPTIGNSGVSDLEYHDPSNEGEVVASLDDKKRIYMQHCFPDIPQIVHRVREVVHDYVHMLDEKAGHPSRWWKGQRAKRQTKLKKVYIMTNGDAAWLAEVKRALVDDLSQRGTQARGGEWEFEWVWEEVSTSRDLRLGWEEKPVAQALDSYVASRAELFVGNGFSSLTSNIVMLRKNNHFDPVQTRFW